MITLIYDPETGNRYARCDCGRISNPVRWGITDDMLEGVLKHHPGCPTCTTKKGKKRKSRKKSREAHA